MSASLESRSSVNVRGKSLLREPGKPLVESLVREGAPGAPLSHARAWAMRPELSWLQVLGPDFLDYLEAMSQVPTA